MVSRHEIFICNMSDAEVGKCCFCGDECNVCSQACGRCVRNRPFGGILALAMAEPTPSGSEDFLQGRCILEGPAQPDDLVVLFTDAQEARIREIIREMISTPPPEEEQRSPARKRLRQSKEEATKN